MKDQYMLEKRMSDERLQIKREHAAARHALTLTAGDLDLMDEKGIQIDAGGIRPPHYLKYLIQLGQERIR